MYIHVGIVAYLTCMYESFVCVCTFRVYASMYVSMYISACIMYMYIANMNVCMHICKLVCVCMHTCMCMHVYIHTYMHTYIHTYIHVHTYNLAFKDKPAVYVLYSIHSFSFLSIQCYDKISACMRPVAYMEVDIHIM